MSAKPLYVPKPVRSEGQDIMCSPIGIPISDDGQIQKIANIGEYEGKSKGKKGKR